MTPEFTLRKLPAAFIRRGSVVDLERKSAPGTQRVRARCAMSFRSLENDSMTKLKFAVMSLFTLLFLFSAGTSNAQLEGIIDEHAHSDPDNVPRRYDALELAKAAKAAGMPGAVLKNHEMPTTQLAYMVSELVPGFQAWGSIVLNRSVGGINPDAVEQQATVKGHFLKIVFMPTRDADNPKTRAAHHPSIPIAKNGVLLPETIEVLKMIIKYDLVLATGHIEPADSLLLIKEARKMGINKILVTHPEILGTTIAQMQEEARDGAYLEFIGNFVLPVAQNGSPTVIPHAPNNKPEEWAADIHAVGAEHCVLSGDFGGPAYVPFIEGWRMYIAALKKAGVTDAEIDLMGRKNPAHLLGMDMPTSAK